MAVVNFLVHFFFFSPGGVWWYIASMAKMKIEKLYNDEHLKGFSNYMKNHEEDGKILLQLAGIIPTKSIIQKAKYSPKDLSEKKMNFLFEKAPFMFGVEERALPVIDLAFHLQKITNLVLSGKKVEVHCKDYGIFYDVEGKTFCTSYEFLVGLKTLLPINVEEAK